jgi:hypothetical protein
MQGRAWYRCEYACIYLTVPVSKINSWRSSKACALVLYWRYQADISCACTLPAIHAHKRNMSELCMCLSSLHFPAPSGSIALIFAAGARFKQGEGIKDGSRSSSSSCCTEINLTTCCGPCAGADRESAIVDYTCAMGQLQGLLVCLPLVRDRDRNRRGDAARLLLSKKQQV